MHRHTDSQTDRLTIELIRVGLVNLRYVSTRLSTIYLVISVVSLGHSFSGSEESSCVYSSAGIPGNLHIVLSQKVLYTFYTGKRFITMMNNILPTIQLMHSTALSLAVLDRPLFFTSSNDGRNPSSSGVSSSNRPVSTMRAMPSFTNRSSPGWNAIVTSRPPIAKGQPRVDDDDNDDGGGDDDGASIDLKNDSMW